MLLRSSISALALCLVVACSSGSEIASPGATSGGTPPSGGGSTGGGGTGTASCPAGFTAGASVAGLTTCNLSGTYLTNVTLRNVAGIAYAVNGRVDIGADTGADGTRATGSVASLTIEPGVTVFGRSGADYIVVNRGSQINANGTASNPIILTSANDLIRRADSDASNDTGGSAIGEWGGLVILGQAPINRCRDSATPGSAQCENLVEGVSNPDAVYGGADASDSSGTLRYVSMRFSGFEIAPGNELNGITLAGVGSGTTVEYVQVHNSSDDGIEIFGGTHNLRYIVINGADDDGLDTDTGWRGGAQFGIVTQRPTTGTSRSAGFEFSAAPTSVPIATRLNSQPKISNFTLVGRQAAVNAHTVAHFDSGSDATVINSVFTNPTGSLSGCLDLADADTVSVAPSFNSVFMSCAIPFRTQSGQAANVPGVFNAGTNNTSNGTSTLQAPASGTTISNQDLRFINGANENAVTVTNAPGTYSAFTPVTFIGAVQNQSDTWWRGWTCGLTAGLTC